MKRKVFAYLCIAVMSVSLIGCGSKTISSSDSPKETETTVGKDETTTKKTSTDSKEETTSTEDETTKNSDVDTSDWTKYSGNGYSISAPKVWIKYEYEASELTLANSVTSTDSFAENISVVTQDISAYDFDLESYKDISLSQYEYLNYTVISTEKLTIDGVDGYYLVCTTEAEGILCYCSQFFTLIDDTAYIFTFAADSKGYQELSEEVLDIFSTVTFD